MPRKCSKCGSYDIDVCTELSHDFECQECGHKIRMRTKKVAARKFFRGVGGGVR